MNCTRAVQTGLTQRNVVYSAFSSKMGDKTLDAREKFSAGRFTKPNGFPKKRLKNYFFTIEINYGGPTRKARSAR